MKKENGAPAMFQDPYCEKCEGYGDCLTNYPDSYCRPYVKAHRKTWWQKHMDKAENAEVNGAYTTFLNKGTASEALQLALEVIQRDMARSIKDGDLMAKLDIYRVALIEILRTEGEGKGA